MKLKKGDNVQIITGKDRGKQGKVISVDVKSGRIFVQGLNLFKKHRRPKKQGEKGEIISVPKSLDISNVMAVCGNCGKPARLGYKMSPYERSPEGRENEIKVRYCKKCGVAV